MGIDGILNLDKPRGMTSHDVVAHVRRGTGRKKVGHAGTLDPLATGVLLVCVGKGTRVAEYLMGRRKRYLATILLGVETDTYDADGEVVAGADASGVTLEEARAALGRFVGDIRQVPPVYSALKRGGRPMYKRARGGEKIEMEPRPVTVYDLRLEAWEPPLLTFEVECSAGTYVRSLAHDVGSALGVGAHVTALRRLASGEHRVEESIPLPEFDAAVAGGRWAGLLEPIDFALRHFPRADVSAEQVDMVLSGRLIELPGEAIISTAGEQETEAFLLRAHAPDGALLALLEPADEPGVWHPRKVFRSR